MEGKKHVGSSSSLTTELFGSKESSCSSNTGIFGSIFAPSSKVLGRDSLLSQTKEGERDSANEPWIPNAEDQGYTANQRQKESQEMMNKDMSSIYQEQRAQPCQFASSIYYGGQDVYAHPQNSHNSGVNSPFKKDGEKMILGVLQEEIGGKGLSIISTRSLAKVYTLIKVHRIIDLQHYYNFTSYFISLRR